MQITLIAGARPNFMKIAPIIHALQTARQGGHDFAYRLVHTGQHYDEMMSKTFFDELRIPKPDVNLGVGGAAKSQTAAIISAFEDELHSNPADMVMVVGDVDSTMACSIVAKKMKTAVSHIEAGIRSFDLSMPEEINRLVTDSIADYFFTTSDYANANLRAAGISGDRIFFVGNVMIDTLLANRSRLKKPTIFGELNLSESEYFVMTMHRPANVDDRARLGAFLREITAAVEGLPIVFPVHPRTRRTLEGLDFNAGNLYAVEPMAYLEFNYLVSNSRAVITDSGGITEEATVMGVPCLTLRDSTERPETVDIGTNALLGTDPTAIRPAVSRVLKGEWKVGGIPPLWDGHAAKRIVECLVGISQL